MNASPPTALNVASTTLPTILLRDRGQIHELFKAIQRRYPSAFLFETADPTMPLPLRTVIGLRADQTIRRRYDRAIQQDVVEKIECGREQRLSDTFFDALENLKLEIRARDALVSEVTAKALGSDSHSAAVGGGLTVDAKSKQHKSIPFMSGGIFGSIGYECIREIEKSVPAQRDIENDLVSAEVFTATELILFDFEMRMVHALGSRSQHALQEALVAIETSAPAPRLKLVAVSPVSDQPTN